MKKISIAILIYLGSIIAGCILAGLASFPFLKPGDFSIEFQMVIMSIFTGFYILAFMPFVIVTEILLRKVSTHYVLPFAAIPIFGIIFPLLGFKLFPGSWWPEEPLDMNSTHFVLLLFLAMISIFMGTIFTLIRNKKI